MFDAQHKQTADRTEDTARLQDRLTGALIGLAHAVVGNEELVNEQTHRLVRDVLIATTPKADLTIEDCRCMLDRIAREKQRLVPQCSICDHPCGRNDDYDMALMWNANENIRSLKSQLLFGIRDMAAIASQSAPLGHADATADAFLLHVLDVLGNEWDADSLRSIVIKASHVKLRCTELLERANTATHI